MSRPTDVTCPGYCCAAFYFPRKISWLRRNAKKIFDGEKIADMLIPLTPKEARERYERFSGESAKGAYPWSQRGHHFTCRHWDEETRLCTIYEERPDTCRDFPYEKPCPHGCDYSGGMSTEKRRAIREEQAGNQWKAYAAPNPPDEHA